MKASIAARALDFEELIKRNDAQRAEIEALTDFKTQVQGARDVLSERTRNIDLKIKKLFKLRIQNILGMVSDVQIQVYKLFINFNRCNNCISFIFI